MALSSGTKLIYTMTVSLLYHPYGFLSLSPNQLSIGRLVDVKPHCLNKLEFCGWT